MLNSGKKFHALRDKKNKYSNSRVVRKKNSERHKNPYPDIPDSFINKTDRHDITELLLKVVLNTITLTPNN